jgi:hypothetical protein
MEFQGASGNPTSLHPYITPFSNDEITSKSFQISKSKIQNQEKFIKISPESDIKCWSDFRKILVGRGVWILFIFAGHVTGLVKKSGCEHVFCSRGSLFLLSS